MHTHNSVAIVLDRHRLPGRGALQTAQALDIALCVSAVIDEVGQLLADLSVLTYSDTTITQHDERTNSYMQVARETNELPIT